MKVIIQPSQIAGSINAPTSKSSMQRACAAAFLNKGQTIIHNPGKSNDDVAALDIITKLGATVISNNNQIIVNSIGEGSMNNLLIKDNVISCGESGLSIRMFTPIAALSSDEIIVNGTGSLLKRPMNFFDEIFPQLGVKVQSNNGILPLKIQGPLQPKNITIDGALSSQFLTGLLFAFAKAATTEVTITVKNLKSKPYIDLTLQVMNHFGYNVENNNYQFFTIKPITQSTNLPINYTIEGDWSGAAFLLVAGAISNGITVKGLDKNSAQADKKILDALDETLCKISFTENELTITPPDSGLEAFHFDATDCPDLFPPLVALAANCNGTSIIEGVSRLIHKESNRALTLQKEFEKFGVEIILQDDTMLISTDEDLIGANVHSHHDHRIAMACAIAAINAVGETVIDDAEAINKSYPNFYEDLKILNADVSLIN